MRGAMNTLYEYIDPIVSPYEAFLCDSEKGDLPIPAHWHYYAELVYLLEGSARFSIDNEVNVCGTGAVVLFPPKCVHAIEVYEKSARVRYYVVKFDVGNLPSGKADDLNLSGLLRGLTCAAYPCCFRPEQMEDLGMGRLFEEIIEEYRKKDYAYSMMLTADVCKIMGKLARCWQKEGYLLPASGIHPRNAFHPQNALFPSYDVTFNLIGEYIDSHYAEALTAEKLAAMCNMSHATFSLHFRRRYGKTCKEYITATRINVAENMLLFSNYDVSFIAQEVGYSDCSYFIRCYKKLKGVTPQQARKAKA